MKIETSTISYTPDDLLGGDFPRVRKSVIIEKGQKLKRGTILVEKKFDRLIMVKHESILKGTLTPMYVLAEDVDSTEGHETSTAYMTGEFSKDHLFVGHNVDLPDIENNLRIFNIYFTNCEA